VSDVLRALLIAALALAGCSTDRPKSAVSSGDVTPPCSPGSCGDHQPTNALADGSAGPAVDLSLDAVDQRQISRATQTALETALPNQPLAWQNLDNGHSGTVVSGPYYQTASGQFCREFRQTVTIGGATQQSHGKACRRWDGTWQIVND